jgi:serine/threonine protein kinase
MAFHLQVIEGPDKGRVLQLADVDTLLVGRSSSTQAALNDPRVSRVHCQLRAEGDRLVVSDTMSSGGTFVNDRRVVRHDLRHGDVLRIGATQLRVHAGAAVNPAPSRPPKSMPGGSTPAPPHAGALDVTRPPQSGSMADRPPQSNSVPGARTPADLQVNAGRVHDTARSLPSKSMPERWSQSVPGASTPAPAASVPATDPLNATLPWDMQFHEPDSAAAAGLIERIGSTVAEFELGPALGQGKTGIVFLAREAPHGRVVALKILRPEFASNADQLQRFERAMKISSTLSHPNLVSIYGTGNWKSCCWIAMEYIEGRSAGRFIRHAGVAGRLNWRIALRLAHDIARALQFAHEHSILHRNVTPSNVLLTKDHVAKLGDLMLAKALDGNDACAITAPNAILGDLPYLSPEQTHGTEYVDARSDIYSLGATVYAVVAGRAPFGGKTASEIMERIRHQAPRSLRDSQFAPVKSMGMTSFQREHITLQLEEMPAEFDRLILRILAKRPAERYESAADLARDIEAVAAEVGVPLPSGPTLR